MSIERSYKELSRFNTFRERFNYLKLGGFVGHETFGYDRYVNQQFYKSSQWKSVRDFVIVRDKGCDLGIPGHEIFAEILVHHMNPMVVDNIRQGDEWITNPDYLITTTLDTHNAIHYGDESLLKKDFKPRAPGDTKLW